MVCMYSYVAVCIGYCWWADTNNYDGKKRNAVMDKKLLIVFIIIDVVIALIMLSEGNLWAVTGWGLLALTNLRLLMKHYDSI